MTNIESKTNWAPGSEQSRRVHEALESEKGVTVFDRRSIEYHDGKKGIDYIQDDYDVVLGNGQNPSSLLNDIDRVNTRNADPKIDERTGRLIPGQITTFEVTNPGIAFPINSDSKSTSASLRIGQRINLVRVNVHPNAQEA